MLIIFKKAGLKLGLNLNVIIPAADLKVTGSTVTVTAAAGNNNGIVINVTRTDYANVFIITLFFIIGVLIGGEI